MARFSYSSDLLAAFPATRGGVIQATRLANGPTPPNLLAAYEAEQQRVREEIGETPLSEIPSLAAWRRTFSAFGVKPTQYRNAAEGLLRRLTKQGDIPSINLLVDLANLVSVRYRLPVAVFDQSDVSGGTTVRFAIGNERFTDLGSDTTSHPEPDEVVFVDEAGLVSARRWCWRQSDQSAAREATVDALITVEGQHDGAEADVTRATADLRGLLADYQPQAEVTSAILSPGSSRFSA
jgi:DNA/RNA-binding domain of Phe-tRNA-synthetase-like protein